MAISEDSRFQKALLELYESANLTVLPDRILTAVKVLIPGEVIAVTDVDAATGAIGGRADPEDYPTGFSTKEESYEVLQQHFHEHPVVMDRRHVGVARRISDYWSAPVFHEKALYCEFYRKMRVEDQVVLMIPTRPGSTTGVAVSRAERSFRAVHVDRLSRLGPHLIQAYRNAERISVLEQCHAIPGGSVAVAMEQLGLGRRQSDVLQLIVSGCSNAEAAARLGVSPLTVKKHLEHIYAILKVRTRSAAVAALLCKLGLESLSNVRSRD